MERLRLQNESLLELTRINDWTPEIKPTLLHQLVIQRIKSKPLIGTEVRLTDLDVLSTLTTNYCRLPLEILLRMGLTYNKPGRHHRLFLDHVSISGGNKISISDNGIRVPTKELDPILSMFYKASTSSRGRGMGLYIARKAMGKLAGEIMATSDEGEESVFSIFLPMN